MAGEFSGLAANVLATNLQRREESRKIEQEAAAARSRRAQIIGTIGKGVGQIVGDAVNQRLSDTERFNLTKEAKEFDPSLQRSEELARGIEGEQLKLAGGGLEISKINEIKSRIREMNREFKRITPTKRELNRRIEEGRIEREAGLKERTLQARRRTASVKAGGKSDFRLRKKDARTGIEGSFEFKTPAEIKLSEVLSRTVNSIKEGENGISSIGVMEQSPNDLIPAMRKLDQEELQTKINGSLASIGSRLNDDINANLNDGVGKAAIFLMNNSDLFTPKKATELIARLMANNLLKNTKIPTDVEFDNQRRDINTLRNGLTEVTRLLIPKGSEKEVVKFVKLTLADALNATGLKIPQEGFFVIDREPFDKQIIDPKSDFHKKFIAPLILSNPDIEKLQRELKAGTDRYSIAVAFLDAQGRLSPNELTRLSTPEVRNKVADEMLKERPKTSQELVRKTIDELKSIKDKTAREERIREQVDAIVDREIAEGAFGKKSRGRESRTSPRNKAIRARRAELGKILGSSN